jgi:MFS transporter, OFA family, oxalate/formate antiporter
LFNRYIALFRRKFPAFHHGYVVVAASFLIMTLAFGMQNSFGVFFKPMSMEFGWSRADTSGPFSLCVLVSGILSILSGRLSDRYGSWKVIAGGAIISGAGYILMADIHSLWQFYLYYGVLVAIGISTIYVPLVALIAHWFTKRRGLMSGIGIAGIGFGMAVVPPLASHILQILGWRDSLMIVGGGVTLAIVLLTLLFRKDAQPSFIESHNTLEQPAKSTLKAGLTFRQAAKSRQFWLIVIGWICYGFFYQSAVVHIVPYATDLGLSAVAAATVLSTIGIIGTVGRVAIGFIGDKLGNSRTVAIGYALMGLSLIGLACWQTTGMLYIFAIIFGFLYGIGVLLIPMVTEYFGFKELGIISGVLVFSNNFGGAGGPPITGAIFDSTGSYFSAFLICGILGLVAAFVIFLLKPIAKP